MKLPWHVRLYQDEELMAHIKESSLRVRSVHDDMLTPDLASFVTELADASWSSNTVEGNVVTILVEIKKYSRSF